jgi:ferric-dicitrate binding protein FerR (iron transport regulator)
MSNERDPELERERLLRRLFEQAEPRPQPPAADTEEIRSAVLAEWEAVTGRRVWRKRAAFAAAAGVALVAALVYFREGPVAVAPASLVASVERVQGAATTADGSRLTVGSGITARTQIETGDAQLALALASGGSLRIGPRSRVMLASGDEAELLAGVLYFDSEGERRSEFAVATQLGRVRDVGTQFLVRLDSDEIDVGVRAGRVDLARGGATDTAGVGERLVASQAASGVRRDSISTYGPEWEWTERVAPPFDIDGRTVSDFLAWFTAQTGRTVEFADAAAERAAREAVLSGSIDLPPMQKLSAVLALTDLTYALDGERVVIRMR